MHCYKPGPMLSEGFVTGVGALLSLPFSRGAAQNLRRRTLYLPLMLAAAVLAVCSVVLLAFSEKKVEAAFPAKRRRSVRTGRPTGAGWCSASRDMTRMTVR